MLTSGNGISEIFLDHCECVLTNLFCSLCIIWYLMIDFQKCISYFCHNAHFKLLKAQCKHLQCCNCLTKLLNFCLACPLCEQVHVNTCTCKDDEFDPKILIVF